MTPCGECDCKSQISKEHELKSLKSKNIFFCHNNEVVLKFKKMILISNHHLSLQDIRQGANAFPFKNKNQKSLLSFNTCEAQYRIFELMEGKKTKNTISITV